MVKLYVKKIKNHELNPNTGLEWAIDDVPIRWREQVRQELEQEVLE